MWRTLERSVRVDEDPLGAGFKKESKSRERMSNDN